MSSCSLKAAVDFIRDHLHKLQVRMKGCFDINVPFLALPFPEFEDGVKAGGIGSGK